MAGGINWIRRFWVDSCWPGIRFAAIVWGKIIVLLIAVILANSALSTVPFTAKIVNAGFISFAINMAFVLGLYFLNTNQDEMVDKCQTLMMLLGFGGTALGMNEFLEAFEPGTQNIEGLKYAFRTTAHGLLGTVILYSLGFFGTAKAKIFPEDDDRGDPRNV